MILIEILSLATSAGISIWLGFKVLKLITPMVKAKTEQNKAITRACAAYADKWDMEQNYDR